MAISPSRPTPPSERAHSPLPADIALTRHGQSVVLRTWADAMHFSNEQRRECTGGVWGGWYALHVQLFRAAQSGSPEDQETAVAALRRLAAEAGFTHAAIDQPAWIRRSETAAATSVAGESQVLRLKV